MKTQITHRELHVTTDADSEALLLQDKECQGGLRGGEGGAMSDRSPEGTNRQHPNQRELITVAIKQEVIVCYSSLGKKLQILKITI